MKRIQDEEVKEILLSIIKRVDEICKDNNLTYFLFSGTLLGAIRHKGFIPWDDDIDILMPRDDYNKLNEIIKSKDDGLSFLCFENDSNYIYPFGKVCRTDTRMIENGYKHIDNLGIYVDVFPLDKQGKDLKQSQALVKKMRILNAFLFESNLDKYHRNSKKWYYEIPKFFMYPVSKIFGTKYWIKKINKTAQKYNDNNSDFCGCNVDPNYHICLKSEWFSSSIEVKFEKYMLKAPIGYDSLLRAMYGDYMQLPPENKRVSHHDIEAYYVDED